ncbi:MAG: energy-coupling factor ABC transporter ATP-binding protein [Oscillospiraceae bacterium]|jgi:energy-coupling factor transport system ATP-binding protein|nr:energy-coupling factor ABC transporter ATP-binding protein [Oscillospiraceae bacterium]
MFKNKAHRRHDMSPSAVPARESEILCFEDVHLSFGDLKLLQGVSFSVRAGEFVILLGENGAGKSTLLRLCNGLIKPASGSVTVRGHDTQLVKTSRIAKEVGFLFQNPDRQIFNKTIREEIEFGIKLHGIPVRESYNEFRIPDFALNDDPFTLSRGERQRVALASVLACEPRLMLLDEPTVGLDDCEARQLMDAVKRRQKENNAAVLLITHDLDLANDYADRKLLLEGGRIVHADISSWQDFAAQA